MIRFQKGKLNLGKLQIKRMQSQLTEVNLARMFPMHLILTGFAKA